MKIYQIELSGGEYDDAFINTHYVGTEFFEALGFVLNFKRVQGCRVDTLDFTVWENGEQIWNGYYDFISEQDQKVAHSKILAGENH